MIKVAVDKKVVQDAKCELVDHLKSKINPDYVKALCREQYGIEMIKAAECKDGNIVIDNDQIAYKLNFEVSFTHIDIACQPLRKSASYITVLSIIPPQ